jgi:hypothetical protein
MARYHISHYFICPITEQIMVDPVICADGITYEKQAITLWLQTHDISPVMGQPLNHKMLIPNDQMKAAIQNFERDRGSSPPPTGRGSPVPAELPHGWHLMSSGRYPVFVNPSSGEISHERPIPPAQHSPSAQPIFKCRSGSAVFKSRVPAQYQSVWEWENDAGTGYNAFDPTVASILETHFLHHARERTQESVMFTYERPSGGRWIFNFDFMIQTNPDTNGMRSIIRR